MREELSTDEMSTLLRDVGLLNLNRVVFTGGEPLLRNDIFTLGQTLHRAGAGQHRCITTNGTLITEHNAKALAESFDEIRISIDGFREVNDASRGGGTFDKAMSAFRHVRLAGGDPVASITVTSLSLPRLKDFLGFLLRNGVSNLHISPLRLAGRAAEAQTACNFGEVKRIVEEFWYDTFGRSLTTGMNKRSNCGVGRTVTVYPDGSVYPCHLLAFPEFCIGNVKKDGLASIYNQSDLMNKLRNLNFNEIALCTEYCKELPVEATCLGTLAQEVNFKEKLLNLLQ